MITYRYILVIVIHDYIWKKFSNFQNLFRESRIFYTPGVTSQSAEEALVAVVAHELGTPKLLFCYKNYIHEILWISAHVVWWYCFSRMVRIFSNGISLK